MRRFKLKNFIRNLVRLVKRYRVLKVAIMLLCFYLVGVNLISCYRSIFPVLEKDITLAFSHYCIDPGVYSPSPEECGKLDGVENYYRINYRFYSNGEVDMDFSEAGIFSTLVNTEDCTVRGEILDRWDFRSDNTEGERLLISPLNSQLHSNNYSIQLLTEKSLDIFILRENFTTVEYRLFRNYSLGFFDMEGDTILEKENVRFPHILKLLKND